MPSAGQRLFSETLLTQQALEEPKSVGPWLCYGQNSSILQTSVEILPTFVLKGRNHCGNVWIK